MHRQRRRLSSASSNEAAIPLLVIPAVRVREGFYHLFDMLAFDRFEKSQAPPGLLAGLRGIAVPVPIVQGREWRFLAAQTRFAACIVIRLPIRKAGRIGR